MSFFFKTFFLIFCTKIFLMFNFNKNFIIVFLLASTACNTSKINDSRASHNINNDVKIVHLERILHL